VSVLTAPVTHQDLGLVAETGFPPDPFRLKRTRKSSVPCRVQMVFHRSYGFEPTPWWLTTWAVKMLTTPYCGWNGLPISPQWLLFQPQPRFTVPASCLSKQFFRLEDNLIPYDEVCCPGQFVREGTVGDHEIGLLHLAIVVGSCLRIIAPCQLSSLREGPG